jgi:hypothetical protein
MPYCPDFWVTTVVGTLFGWVFNFFWSPTSSKMKTLKPRVLMCIEFLLGMWWFLGWMKWVTCTKMWTF